MSKLTCPCCSLRDRARSECPTQSEILESPQQQQQHSRGYSTRVDEEENEERVERRGSGEGAPEAGCGRERASALARRRRREERGEEADEEEERRGRRKR